MLLSDVLTVICVSRCVQSAGGCLSQGLSRYIRTGGICSTGSGLYQVAVENVRTVPSPALVERWKKYARKMSLPVRIAGAVYGKVKVLLSRSCGAATCWVAIHM
jgi:hypothetical protein